MRLPILALRLSAVALVSIAGWEGYKSLAYIPVPGDVPTIGFGTTKDVKMGDTIDPVTALQKKLRDVEVFEGAIKQCVHVPLSQHEYDAYLSLAYNIGSGAFCRSTLVRKLNAGDYEGACKEILRWNYFRGKPLQGLTNRRQAEYKQCMGT